MGKRELLASAGACGLLFFGAPEAGAVAPGATPVTQSAQHDDAATFVQSQANGVTSCNTTAQTAASDTITMTPPAGYFVYLTEIYILHSMDATGQTSVKTISSTNLTGSPIWSTASTLTTVQGPPPAQVETWPLGLKSTSPGTAVTLVPSATQGNDEIVCMHATGYFAPGP